MSVSKRSEHPSKRGLGNTHEEINRMFSGIVPSYDLLNHVLSFGMDFLWRRRAARALSLPHGGRVLDMACGTGDMGVSVARVCRAGRISVIGVDPSFEMLLRGKKKAGGTSGMAFVQARAEKSPIRDDMFDAVTMAFGIRNLPDRSARMKGLREFHRFLRPGGRLAVLEFSPPRSWFLRMYIHHVLPFVGNLVSRSSAYTYLRDTIMEFPDQEGFSRMMVEAGFARVSWKNLSFGAATLYIGEKPSV